MCLDNKSSPGPGNRLGQTGSIQFQCNHGNISLTSCKARGLLEWKDLVSNGPSKAWGLDAANWVTLPIKSCAELLKNKQVPNPQVFLIRDN